MRCKEILEMANREAARGLFGNFFRQNRIHQKVEPSALELWPECIQIVVCSVAKPSDWIWTKSPAERTRSFPIWHASVSLRVALTCANMSFELHIKMTPRAPFQKLYTVKLPMFQRAILAFASGERNMKFLRLLCRQNHSESTDYELNMRPPYCNRTTPWF